MKCCPTVSVGRSRFWYFACLEVLIFFFILILASLSNIMYNLYIYLLIDMVYISADIRFGFFLYVFKDKDSEL